MAGSELIIKKNNMYWIYKIPIHGGCLENFIIDQRNSFQYSPEELLKKFISFYEVNFYRSNVELNSFYPQGFKTRLEGFTVNSALDIAELMFHLENLLFEKIISLNLDPHCEEMLECLNENGTLLVDYDQEKIFGFLNEAGDFVIFDKDYKPSLDNLN